MQKACGHPEGLPQFVSVRFQVLFHSPPGVLFTFPSRYWFTIGYSGIFSLTRWSSQIQKGFHVSLPTWDTILKYSRFRLQDFHLLWYSIPTASSNTSNWLIIVPQPSNYLEFRLIPFRSPLLRESLLLSFPLVTKMFQFTRFALSSLVYSRSSSRSFLIRVFSDQNLLPVPRNISSVATHFIASEHQGIRRKLLIA